MATETTMASPSLTTIAAAKKLKSARVKMTIPFTLQCEKCGRITNKGDKFLGFKREIGMDSSLEVEIYRYQFKCPCCPADFSIKSDPGRYDYVVEAGAIMVPKKF